MAIDPRNDPNGFIVQGIEPSGPEWDAAGPVTRRKFWTRVGQLAAEAKDTELAKGLDRFGKAMIPIAKATRKARQLWDYSPMGISDPKAPPLTPVYFRSRTRSLIRWKPYSDGVAFWWAYDVQTGRPWGEILNYHRGGIKTKHGRCVRDVIGLSPRSLADVNRRASAWWRSGNRELPEQRSFRTKAGQVFGGGLVGASGPVPIKDYSTGHRRLKNGAFTASDFKTTIGLAGVGVKNK